MRTIPFGRPMLGDAEKRAALEAMDSGILAHGKRILEFETAFAAFTGAPHAIGVASCTAALHLVYFYLGLGPGDEVIVPAQTHTATAHAAELCGARPVFVDAEQHSGNLNIDHLEAVITPRTRALSLVHYLGMPVEMPRLLEVAQRHNLFVVEDSALAIGTCFDGVHAGLHGDVGCFSFYPVKHITTAEGGMLITKHREVADKIRTQRAFGIDRHFGERKIPGIYDVQGLGFNYRLNEISAAIGVEQMKQVPTFLERRRANYERLTAGLHSVADITLLQSTHGPFQSSYYCHSMILGERYAPRRAAIVAMLNAEGVGTSVYYPHPVPRMTYYRQKYGYRSEDFPVSAWISDCSIALPVGPHLGAEDIDYMIDTIRAVLGKVE
jgi:perosamine synthetase